MPLACTGVNHRTASVALRERLALGPVAQQRLLHESRQDPRAPFTELAILSTCNRTEVYAAPLEASGAPLELLSSIAAVPPASLLPHTYHETGVGAVRRLCRVAAGLDSMVLGESEIQGQVAAALQTAEAAGTAGPVLSAAFHAAVQAGRRARAETGISHLPTSVSSEAIRLLRDVAGPLDNLSVLLVGTGKMGRLAGQALRRATARLRVISRTADRARELARLCDAEALGWHELAEAIAQSDAIICSTAAPHAVVSRDLVRGAIATGGARRRVFVDIAVPRDVEPEVRALEGCELYDLDTLQLRLAGNLETRRQEIPAVETIVEQEVERFDAWQRRRAVHPLLVELRAQGEAIRQREVARVLRRHRAASPEVAALLDEFSKSLVNKLLHEPTRRLSTVADPDLARALFGLDAG
ncbi:MAG TPA: glutamyl-tRNA reductase [Gemmatimonadales bacterium]|nr:glutamyl-tRNA reductase [Gemmatimonadales bacterium]